MSCGGWAAAANNLSRLRRCLWSQVEWRRTLRLVFVSMVRLLPNICCTCRALLAPLPRCWAPQQRAWRRGPDGACRLLRWMRRPS